MSTRSMLTGIAIAIGAVLVAPVVLPVAVRLSKPLLKAAAKAGVLVYERGREAVAEMGELAQDLLAEIQTELNQEQAPAQGAEEPAPHEA